MSGPRVLYLSPGLEEYASDGLLHGLRRLLGERVVDYPKHELLYETCPPEVRRSVRGYGMTLYGLLEDVPIVRARVLEQLRWGQFDLVVVGDVTKSFGALVELLPFLEQTRVAVIDGSDAESIYPYAGTWWRRRAWRTLPRAHTRFHYFKRELTPRTLSYRWYRLVPPAVAARLPHPPRLHPFSFSVPEEKIVAQPPPKDRDLASHVVDLEVAERLGLSTSGYVFDSEDAYYADLQRSRFGITTKRGGWDCLRHYELAANACVPCFRDLERKPSTCAPHGLDETNCVPYRDADDLLRKLERIDDARYLELQAGALAWAREKSTVRQAERLLAAVGLASDARAARPRSSSPPSPGSPTPPPGPRAGSRGRPGA